MSKKTVNHYVLNNPLRIVQVSNKAAFKKGLKFHGNVIVRDTTHWQTFLMEADQYTRVYANQKNRLLFRSLSPHAREIFFEIMMTATRHSGQVNLYVEELKNTFGYKSATQTYNAIRELIRADIIHKDRPHWYSMNPDVFFSGNPVKYYQLHAPQNLRLVRHHQQDEITADPGIADVYSE